MFSFLFFLNVFYFNILYNYNFFDKYDDGKKWMIQNKCIIWLECYCQVSNS